MKAAEIRDMTDDELFNKEKDLARATFNLKIQHATGQLENTSQLRATKRDLARVKTIIKERGIKN
jgi:large subunit ribosomal protein L29